MFEVGDKVVCIDTDGFDADRIKDMNNGIFNTYPVIEGQYTVRGISKQDGIWLAEIQNRKYHYRDCFTEKSWDKKRFVKLSELSEMEEALEEVKQILEMVSDFKPFP